jgi:transcriptional regulator with XRE-family HTH domain
MNRNRHRLGDTVRHRRELLGLSARELARRIGTTDTTVLRIESGASPNPHTDTLSALAEALDLPYADLFAAAGYAVPAQLPTFQPYLRTKYGELPPAAVAELEQHFAEIARRYGTQGPLNGEDER